MKKGEEEKIRNRRKLMKWDKKCTIVFFPFFITPLIQRL